MRLSACLPALLLLGSCTPVLDQDYPTFTAVDVWCDSDGAGWWWNFWAEVGHEDGPRAVTAVVVEGALPIGDSVESLMLAEMDYLAEGQWGTAIHDDDVGSLDCDLYDEYVFYFTAQDVEGDAGWVDEVVARREEPLR